MGNVIKLSKIIMIIRCFGLSMRRRFNCHGLSIAAAFQLPRPFNCHGL
jgi:hypothetical protein